MPLQMKEAQKVCQIQLGLLLRSCYSYYNSTGGQIQRWRRWVLYTIIATIKKPKPLVAWSPIQNIIIEVQSSLWSSQFHIGDCVLAVLTMITIWCRCYSVTTITLCISSICRLWSPCTEPPVDSVLHDWILCKLEWIGEFTERGVVILHALIFTFKPFVYST